MRGRGVRARSAQALTKKHALSLTSHLTAHSRSYPHLMRHAHDPMPIWVTARQSGPPDTVQQARSTFVESCPWSPRMPFTTVLRTW